MYKYILGIDGMRCGMCESHVADVIRKNIVAKKIKASHIKKLVVVISSNQYTLEDFKKFINPTGYKVTSFKIEEAVKSLFGWK